MNRSSLFFATGWVRKQPRLGSRLHRKANGKRRRGVEMSAKSRFVLTIAIIVAGVALAFSFVGSPSISRAATAAEEVPAIAPNR